MLIQQTKRKKTKHKLLAWFTLATFVVQPALAFAQAVADPNAAAANRPVIDNAANNVPIVQIAAPSAAGVSHNLYQQLNIDPNGLIFNNSLGITSTQLAGYIAANPNLKGTAAHIILNEVTGTGASYLKGYAEIAGQKADLIIANPNGIVGDGFGFINANRAVLTTGTPVFGGSGSLDAFRVTRGQITVQGEGIDATGADRLDLLSRAAAINAGLWAKDLNVVTGANQVSYDQLQTNAITGEGVQPTVALDVSALGGMYAHKIKLVGTEKGVGVNSKGTLAASSGDLTLTQEGKIQLGGKTSASGTIALTGQDDIVHTGQLYGQTVTAQTTGTLTNSGLLAAAGDTTITAQTLQSTGTLGAGIQTDGKSGTVGNLTITTSGATTAAGRTVAAGDLVIQGASLDISGGTTYAGHNASLTTNQGNLDNTGGTIEAGNSLQLTAQGTLANRDGGSLTADQITVSAIDIDNHSGAISQSGTGTTTLTALQTLDNNNGKILTNGTGKINAKALYNDQGILAAEQGIAVAADTLSNQHGTIASAADIQLTAAGSVTNAAGIIEAGHGLALTAASLDNTSGSITSLGPEALTVTVGGDIANQSGLLGGNGDVQVTAGTVANQAGKVTAKENLIIQSASEIDNTTGTLSAGEDLSLQQTTGTLTNAAGTIQAGQDLTIATDRLNSTGKLFAGLDMTVTGNDVATSGQLLAGRDLQLTAGTLLNQGTVQADGSVTLQADGTLTNDGNLTALQGLAISGKDIQNNEAGAIKSGSKLHIDATDRLTNAGTVYGKEELQVQADEVTNIGALAAAGNAILTANTLASTGTLAAGLQSDGTLGTTGNLSVTTTGSAAAHGQTLAGGNLVMQGSAVDISGGTTYAGNTATITATEGDVNNTGGSLTAKDLTIQAQGALINNKDAAVAGKIQADKLAIQAAAIRNQGGTLVQYGQTDLILAAANGIDNTGGQIAANSTNLSIDTSAFTNTHGQVQHAGNGILTIDATGNVANDAGKIISNGALNLSAQDINNTEGTLTAQRQVAITATSVDNTQGMLMGKEAVTLTVQGAMINREGTLEAGKGLSVTSRSLDNQGGSVTSLDDSDLALSIAEAVNNESGLIGGNGNVQLAVNSLANTSGRVVAKADLALLTKGDITNTQGTISAGQNLTVEQATGSLTNTQGTIQASNDLTLAVSDIANGAGELLANRDIHVQAHTVQNSGTIGAGRDVNLELQGNFTNESGSKLQASRKLTLTAGGAISNQGQITALDDAVIQATDLTITSDGTVKSGKAITLESDTLTHEGTVYAKTDLTVEVTGEIQNTSVLAAGSNTTLTAKQLDSSGTIAAGLKSDGTIGTTGDLSLVTSGTAATHGQTLAGNTLTLTGAAVDISGGTTYAGTAANVTATDGDVDNTGGSLTASDLQIRARGALVNNKSAAAAGSIKADQLTIHANEIRNKGGTLVQYGQTDLTLAAANGIDNTGGQIATNSTNLTIDTSDFTNTQGQVQHAGNGTLTLDATGNIANDAGKIIGNGAMNLTALDMDNTKGTLTAQRQVDITATSVDNTQGVMVGKEAVILTAQGAVVNQAGTLEAGKGLSVTARSLDNQDGSLTSLDDNDLAIQAGDAVTNAGGLIGGNGNVQIAADSLDNTAGQIVAKADLALQTKGDITNTQGTVSAGHNLTVEQAVGSLTNTQGIIQAGNDLTIHAAELHNTAGRILANRDLTLVGKTATNSGVLYGGRDVQVTLEDTFINEAGGEMLADRNLTLAADGTVTNSSKLTAVGDASVRGGNLANTSGAALKSGQSLTLSTTGNLLNEGSLYAKEDVTADSAGKLSNSGAVAAGGDTVLTAQNIHSTGTLIAGIQGDGSVGTDGALTVTAIEKASLNGRNLAGHTVTVTGEAIDTSNSTTYAGTRAALTATAGDINNSGGSLTAKEVAMNAQGAVINNKNAQGAASIQADKLSIQAKNIRNQGGTIVQYGQSDLTLSAEEGIDNSGGQLATNSTNLTIDTNQLTNGQGQIQHAGSGNLVLVTSGRLDNTQGRIISNGTVAIDSKAVTNTSGSVSAQDQLTMEADSLANRQGVLVSQNAIQLTVQGAADNQQGLVEAGKGLQLTAQSLDNSSGKLTSLDDSGLVLTTDGEVHNQAGLIGSNGAITLTADGLDNTSGQVQAKTDLTVKAAHDVENTSGTLSAGHDLTLTQQAGTLTNTQGTIQAGNDLSVRAANLANTQGRLLASRDATLSGQTATNSGTLYGGRDVHVDLTGAFTNSTGGEVQADRIVTLTADGALTNQGKITALQAATLEGAAINNSATGAIKSGGNMTLAADGSLTNTGTVVAQGNLAADSGAAFTSTGVLAAAGNVTVQAQQVTASGTLAAGIQSDGSLGTSGDLTVKAVNTAALQGQTLAAHDLTVTGAAVALTGGTAYAGHTAAITATSGSIDNTGSTLEAKDTAKLTAAKGGVINNKNIAQLAGTIRAGQLDITAKTIRNQGTLIQYGTGDTAITTNALDNTGGQLATNGTNVTLNANTILNTNGQIQHAGTGVFSLQTAELDNTGGRLITNGAGDIATAVFKNKSGTVSAQKQLTVDANSLDNEQGILVTKDTLTVTAQGNVKNREGVIEAGKGLSLTAQTVNNEHGSITSLGEQSLQVTTTGAVDNQSGMIGGNGQVTVTAASLANQSGTVQAQGNLTVTTPQGVNNTHGTLSAGKDLTLDQAGSTLVNDQGKVEAGQSLNIKTKEITNTAGRLAANKNVSLAFTGITGDGTVEAGQDLALTIAGSFTNEAGNTWKANNDVTIAATGAITNRGSLEAGDNLTVSGSSVTNEATGLLAANKELTVTTAGDFTNMGSAFGKELTVTADHIVNANETAVIAANDNVKLFAATSVANLDGATIYSQGDIAIAGSAEQDATGQYVTRTRELLNQSASIEADRDISISADEVANKMRSYTVEEKLVSEKRYDQSGVYVNRLDDTLYLIVPGSTSAIRMTSGGNKDVPSLWLLNESVWEQVLVPKSSQALILSGRNLFFYTDNIFNDQSKILANELLQTNNDTVLNNIAVGSQRESRRKLVLLDTYCERSGNFTDHLFIFKGPHGPHGVKTADYFKQFLGSAFEPSYERYRIGETYTEIITEQLPGSTSATFGGGKSVTIQGTNINNVTISPGSVTNIPNPLTASGHTSSATNQSSSNTPTGTGINANVSGSNVTVNTDSKVTSIAQAGSATVTPTGNTVPVSVGINTNVSNGGVEVNSGNGVTSSEQVGNAIVNQGNGTAPSAANVNTNVPSSGITLNTGNGVASTGQTSKAITSQGNTNTVTTKINTTVATGDIPADSIQTLLPSAQTGPVTPPQTNNGGTITVPANGMYAVHTEPTAHYLVETNSRFTSYKNFISSDYMLEKLNIDPAATMKRLGDGFYEQKLVREQITELIGRVYLSGYESAEAQYQALLENGAAVAQAFHLQVGIALSAEQMKQLTTPIVWMVEQEVNGQKVLVPVVYLPQVREGDLRADGAVIAADVVTITADGKVTNAGTIKANEKAQISAAMVSNLGGSIDGGNLTKVAAAEDLFNLSGTITGDNVSLSAGKNFTSETATFTSEVPFHKSTTSGNTATITAGQNLTISAVQDLDLLGSQLTAGANLGLTAGGDLDASSVLTQESWNAGNFKKQQVKNELTTLKSGGNLTIGANQDLTLTGVQASAGENLAVAAGGDTLLNTVKDSAFSDVKTGNSKNYKRVMTNDETVIGTNLAANKDLTINTGSSLIMEGSSAVSENGKIAIAAADDITIGSVTETHEALTESKKTKSGFASKKTTIKKDYSIVNEVVGSTISGDSVEITAGVDLTVQAGNIVGTHDVSLMAGNDLTIVSAAETGAAEHYKYTKKSGLFSDGGLGFTIGSQSEKSTLKEQTLGEVGSKIGSVEGSVTLTAGNQVNSAGTAFISAKDLDITGKTVNIDNTVDTYDSQSKYEFKQSGLSVSLNGGSAQTAMNAVGNIERASQVSDERLQALYAYKAYEDVEKLSKIKDEAGAKKDVSVSISIGSSKFTSEQTVHSETVNTSDITAGGTVTIKATEGDVNLSGVKLDAKDLTITAADDINIDAAQNKLQIDTNTSSSSWAVGASLGTNTSYFANVSKGSGKENQDTVTQVGSLLNADGTVQLVTGKDLTISGSQVKGGSILADIGGDLNIVSLQDTDDYIAKNKNSGIGVSTGPSGGVTGSYNQGKTNSTYASVTEQAGIFAGEGGFDITVGGNTDLKGAVIASDATPDKNKLSTDTLTFSGIENKAEYSASSTGVNLDTRKTADAKDAGLTPAIGTKATGDADSITKSAIAEGTIEVRNGDTNLNNLSRDTANSLNALGKIFDKKTVAEQQELAKVFGEVAYKIVGDIAQKHQEKAYIANSLADSYEKQAQEYRDAGELEKAAESEKLATQYKEIGQKSSSWNEGGTSITALHALVGGLMAEMGGGSFASGAVGAGATEASRNLLKDLEPDLQQWGGAIIGAAAAETVGGNAQTGASTAVSGTANNDLAHGIAGVGKGVYDGICADIKGLAETFSNPLDAIGAVKDVAVAIYELGKDQGFGAVFAELGTALSGDSVNKYNAIQNAYASGEIDENTRDYRLGNLAGELAYLIATTVPSPEKLAINPGIISKLDKVTALKKTSAVLDEGKELITLPELVVTGEKIKKIEVTGEARKYWTQATEHNGIKVYQRNDLINPNFVDGRGRTNLQRMEQGLAPIGPDGSPINLHHMTQTNDSAIAEITQSFHQENTKVIHINPNTIPSGIDRNEFNKWRSDYWKNRANDFK